MKFRVRQYERSGTERTVESDDASHAPDNYVAEFVRAPNVGDTTFVEVLDGSEWVLWRVETLVAGKRMLFTRKVTKEAYEAEVAEWKKGAS